jgi:Tol biopolymer transport system component
MIGVGQAPSGRAAHQGKNGKIVFVRGGDLWTIEANGSGLQRLTRTPKRGEANPRWSPDGAKLAYDDGSEVFVANADGSGAIDITTPSIKDDPTYFGGGGCDSGPTWSPDGQLLAVSAVVDGCTGAAGEIDAMTYSGTGRRVIEKEYEGVLGGDTQPDWGPGGKRIVITRSDSLRMASGPYVFDLYLLDAKTGKVVLRLTRDGHSTSADFSPNGQQLVFVDRQTVTVRTQSGKLIRLVSGRDPAWAPDAKKIVYAGVDGLRLIGPNGSGNRLLLKCACASPDWQRLP